MASSSRSSPLLPWRRSPSPPPYPSPNSLSPPHPPPPSSHSYRSHTLRRSGLRRETLQGFGEAALEPAGEEERQEEEEEEAAASALENGRPLYPIPLAWFDLAW
uniref:Uncharacterized protein n=1 Tax=Ananas comosus var. bracteatus TaxID=296719 RepID=A0A6V7PMP5_ANACO|nr:unnamed protein product [Ananas comosus var. bracteatus]